MKSQKTLKFTRKRIDEIRKMSTEEFCEYMEEWDRQSKAIWTQQNLSESEIPQFESIEAAREFYGATSFDELEHNIVAEYEY